MPRIQPIDIDQAEGKAKTLLEGVNKAMGMTPNGIRTLAHSPAALDAYLGFGNALGGGGLGAKLREQIAVTVARINGCDYCLAAHSALGKRVGLDEGELRANMNAESADAKVKAALQFAKAIVEEKGWVTDEQYEAVRSAGFGQGEILEILAVVTINTFTNYLNHLAQTEVDFPAVEVGEPASACACGLPQEA